MTPEEKYNICKSCEFLRNNNTCKKCNCFMPVKVRMSWFNCPIKNW